MSYFDNIEGRNQPDVNAEHKNSILRPKTAVYFSKSTKNIGNLEKADINKQSLPAFIKITSKRPAELAINKN